ncbi:MAG: flavodoxin [Chloroflexota bacterium]
MQKQLRALVVYYSFEGNTRHIAQAIAAELGADLLELRPVRDVPTRGFIKYAWGGSLVVMGRKPPLEPFAVDTDDYDLLFIGTPVWAFTYAPALRSFFAQVALRGREFALYCCHEGGPGKTLAHMARALPDNDILDATDFRLPLAAPAESAARARAWARQVLARRRQPRPPRGGA